MATMKRKLICGIVGITAEAITALRRVMELPADRRGVYMAAMKGREVLYVEPDNCDYWRSVKEAADIARTTFNPEAEIDWFGPIPQSGPVFRSILTLCDEKDIGG